MAIKRTNARSNEGTGHAFDGWGVSIEENIKSNTCDSTWRYLYYSGTAPAEEKSLKLLHSMPDD